MAVSEVDRNYYNEYGDKIPYFYFASRDEAREVARRALNDGERLTSEAWLRAAGYTDAAIREIKDDDLLI